MPSGLLLLGAASWLAYGCEGDAGAYDDVANWLCFGDDAECACYGVEDPASVEDDRQRVTSCRPELDCCFVIDRGKDGYECVCLSAAELGAGTDTGAGGAGGAAGGEGGAQAEAGGASGDPELACTRLAVERGSPTVVGHCPPIELDDASVCAFLGESCDRDYLEEQGLIACCEGSHCGQNAFGENVCVP
jgi:hypothetical protein